MAATFFDEEASASRRPAASKALGEPHRVREGLEAALGDQPIDQGLLLPAYSAACAAASGTPSPSSVARAPSSRGLPATCAW